MSEHTPLRVLIVDDSEDDAILMARQLARHGYQVTSRRMEELAEYQTELAGGTWEVILCDYHLPTFSGLQALEVYRASGLDIPFLVVSGAVGEEVAVRAMKAGAHDYVLKGNLTRLGPAVERELKEAGSRRDRRRAELALMASEGERDRMAMAVEQAAEAVIITDPEGLIQYVNPAFTAVSGYRRAETMGKTPRILKSGRQDEQAYHDLWATIKAGLVWKGHLVNQRKDGSLYDQDTIISPLKNADGVVSNFVAVCRDVSRETSLHEQLVQSQKMEAVGKLAGGVAHDFNNLLMIVLNNAIFVRDALPEGSPQRGDLDEIVRTAHRGADLTRQLLAFSRQQILESRVADLNEVVEGFRKLMGRLIGEDIRIAVETCPEPLPVKVDVGQFEQVLMNLAVNARDAMPKGGTLTIRLAKVADCPGLKTADGSFKPCARVVVQDTGVGIAPAVKERIFEPFFSTKPVGRGTGLGLSTVYGIISQHHGAITVESEEGRGAVFVIHLPLSEEKLVSAVTPSLAPPRGDEHLLVVEDEAPVQVVVERILTYLGYTVQCASSAQEALALIKSGLTIDLMVADVVMPGMDGVSLAKQARVLRPEFPVLFLSGYPQEKLAEHGILQLHDPLVSKPCSAYDLALAVRRLLDQRGGKAE